MNPISRWLGRRRADCELAEEMAAHIEEIAQTLMEQGQSKEEAHRNARLQFGNTTLLKERSREVWGWNAIEQVIQDVRFGCGMLAKTPGFTVIAIAVLALGIGMNTAMFSAVKAVLLSALPYPDPGRLVKVWQTTKTGHSTNVSWLDFKDWRSQNRSMEPLAAYQGAHVSLSGNFTSRRIQLAVVSRGFFQIMGTQAAIGRTFTRKEQTLGGPPTAILSYALSEAVFGQAAQGIGKTVRMDGLAFTVIGVMPPRFDFPFRAQTWIPEGLFPAGNSGRSVHQFQVVGRLRPGVPIRQAQADMNVIAARLGKQYAEDRGQGIHIVSLYDDIVGSARMPLVILLAAVALVLLIACVNISNLQMSRATARLRELGLRNALGASRGRLIRQLLTESVLLASAGGALGFLLAVAGTAALRHAAPANIPRIESMRIDWGVLLFTTGLSISVGILFGVLPAIFCSRANAAETINQSSAKATASPQLKRWGNALVIGQIALSMVLLAGAAILLKSYWKLDHINSGLKSSGVITADIWWATANGITVNGKEVARSSRQILDSIRHLPGVQAAAFIDRLPVRDGGNNWRFEIEGRPLPADPHQRPIAYYRLVTRSYFQSFGLPILRGRQFNAHDDYSPQQVAIVNQAFARKFFVTENSIGQRIRLFGFGEKPQFMTIVGVVPDVHAFGLNHPTTPEIFADYMQHVGSRLKVTLVVRGPAGDEPAMRSLITSINPNTPVSFHSMNDIISGTISRERFQTFLLSLFAGVGLLLSAIGIYGLLSYTVTRRTSELGIRMALGANRGAILALVLRQGGRLVIAGLILGLVAAFLLTRMLSSLLFEVKPNDPASFATVAILFGAVAMLGCYLPARRASKIDPNVALRYE
jgi:putative ABC transport system permease protein